MKSLDALKQKGFDVEIQHERFYHVFDPVARRINVHLLARRDATQLFKDTPLDLTRGIQAKGGRTVVVVHTPRGTVVGIAVCHPDDAYSRLQGVNRAIKDARQQIIEGKFITGEITKDTILSLHISSKQP